MSGCIMCATYYLVVSSPPATAWLLTLWAFIWLCELKLIPHLSHVKISSSFSVSDIRDMICGVHIVLSLVLYYLHYQPSQPRLKYSANYGLIKRVISANIIFADFSIILPLAVHYYLRPLVIVPLNK
jgi:hypothetical protein